MKKILLFEDDNSICIAVKTILECEGYSVYVYDSGRDAIKIISVLKPDVIVCDIMLPGQDGCRILEEKNACADIKEIPWIFLTAKTGMDNLRLGMNLGADDYITKPFASKDLLKSIELRLTKKESSRNQIDLQKAEEMKELQTRNGRIILLKDKFRSEKVCSDSIVYIEAMSEYTKVHLSNNHIFVIKKSLIKWLGMLNKNFVRIHKSTIINLDFFESINYSKDNKVFIKLKNTDKDLEVSKRNTSIIKRRIKNNISDNLSTAKYK